METKTARLTNMKPRGQLTAATAKHLQDLLKEKGYDVLYDHGDPSNENVGKIVSWYGSVITKEARLSFLDIAVVKQNSQKTFVLVEIEETTNKPKTLLGDVFGTLMGEHITFRGKHKRELHVGAWTTLIVIGFSKMPHEELNQYILDKVEKVKSALATRNSEIGKVIIETFSDEKELSPTQVAEKILELASYNRLA
jgi:hypothetical protein